MRALQRYYDIVGTVNEWIGRVSLWFFVPMAFLVAFEVIMRYVFNAPTIWTWNVNVFLLASMSALGGGYALLYGSHVKVDIFSTMLPPRAQAILSFITWLLSVASLALLSYYLSKSAYKSTLSLENDISVWGPPIWPIRIAVAFGTIMFFFQATCNLLQSLMDSLGFKKPQAGAN